MTILLSGVPGKPSKQEPITTVFYYDPLNRPIARYNDLPTPGNDVNMGYSYNAASQISERSRDNDAYAWTGAYNVSRGYSVNGLNQYTAARPASFTYDANGNLTSDGTTSYIYEGTALGTAPRPSSDLLHFGPNYSLRVD